MNYKGWDDHATYILYPIILSFDHSSNGLLLRSKGSPVVDAVVVGHASRALRRASRGAVASRSAPLARAAPGNHLDVVKYLLAAGAEKDTAKVCRQHSPAVSSSKWKRLPCGEAMATLTTYQAIVCWFHQALLSCVFPASVATTDQPIDDMLCFHQPFLSDGV